MTDQIVYCAVTVGGGIDGRDHTDKGGRVMWAGLNKSSIPGNYQTASWYRIESRVVDLAELAKRTFARLDPLEQLSLRQNPAAVK